MSIPPGQASRSDRAIYLSVGAVMLAVIIALSLALRQVTEQRDQGRLETIVNSWVSRLSLPDEALKLDDELLRTLSRQRVAAYLERDIAQFLPFSKVLRITEDSSSTRADQQESQSQEIPVEDNEEFRSAMFENAWRYRAFSASEYLWDLLDQERGDGAALLKNREIYDARVVPLLRRLLRARDPFLRRGAGKALLAGGDRSELTVKTFKALAAAPGFNAARQREIRAWIVQYGLD